MKKLFLFAAIIGFSLTVSAQEPIPDTLTQFKNSTISVQVPVKAVVLYAYYMSQYPSWENRKAPDYFLTIIGTGTKPDSLVNVTVTADNLAVFAMKLSAERYGTINTTARSIFNNSPAISGYTALFTQVANKANGNTGEKGAAQYVVAKYNAYSTSLTNHGLEMYQSGLDWIRN
jgi:hypothetical protein